MERKLKDQWKLLEESISGNFGSYLLLNEKAKPFIVQFFLMLSSGQEEFAFQKSVQVLSDSFSTLKKRSSDITFLRFILNHYQFSIADSKSDFIRTNDDYQKFINYFCQKYSYGLFIIDPIALNNSQNDMEPKFLDLFNHSKNNQKELISSISVKVDGKLQTMISSKSSYGIPTWVLIIVVFVVTFIVVLAWPKTDKKEISNEANTVIEEAPVSKIFDDYLVKLRNTFHEGDFQDNVEEMEQTPKVVESETADPEITNDNIIEEKVTEPGDVAMPAPAEPEKVEQKNEPIVSKSNSVENGMAEIEPIEEDPIETDEVAVEPTKTDEVAEPDMVIIKDKAIPLLPDQNKKEGAIVLGDNNKKYNLKDFQDQKVVFYSFLEVKDVEKAKTKAFEILKKFGYKGEVLKKEKDYMILTATFPGKVNHDTMIKKFNGLGTLYVGNDVAEFLELYKKDLDKERSLFFPKYKPEDLPKEVTVNLYIFPKQKK